jgi:hypothetical protein
MPTNGMSSSAAALRYWERRQAVLTHNLANAETAGFKAERVFARMIDDALPVADTATDLRAGALTTTGSPGDLALEGDGFFRVETPAGERWTRGGSFRPDAEGRLVDPNGNPLLGEGGPIEVGSGDFTVAPDGTVRAGGQEVGRPRSQRAAGRGGDPGPPGPPGGQQREHPRRHGGHDRDPAGVRVRAEGDGHARRGPRHDLERSRAAHLTTTHRTQAERHE